MKSNKYVNEWIKRHYILSKDNYIKFYYRKGNSKYLVRSYKDLVRYGSDKYLEVVSMPLNSSNQKEIIEFKNEEILKLKPLGEIKNINNKDFYIIEWSKDDIENKGEVGNLF